MGGSSLGPEVLAKTFPQGKGLPETARARFHRSAQVARTEAAVDLAKTLFIVSSKFRRHHRANALKDTFTAALKRPLARARLGGHFVAVTDPARRWKGRQDAGLSRGPSSRSGDRRTLLGAVAVRPVPRPPPGSTSRGCSTARRRWCAPAGRTCRRRDNPACSSGSRSAAPAARAATRRTMLASPDIAARCVGRALIAESTGKDGKGLIPIDGEERRAIRRCFGDDRIFIALRTEGEADAARDAQLAALEIAGHPWCASCCRRSTASGRILFRFEMATAVAGAVLASIRSTSRTSKPPRSRPAN